jgi:MFS superfamily sulfate permease-like transporter
MLFGVGVGNFALAFIFGTMSASGSATRTALNYQLHAQTRIAALCGGLLTAIIL